MHFRQSNTYISTRFSRYFLIYFLYNFSKHSFTSDDLTILSYYKIKRFSLYKPKPPSFHHFFYGSFTALLTQHSHLYFTCFIFVMVLYCPTFSCILHLWSYCCRIKNFFIFILRGTFVFPKTHDPYPLRLPFEADCLPILLLRQFGL